MQRMMMVMACSFLSALKRWWLHNVFVVLNIPTCPGLFQIKYHFGTLTNLKWTMLTWINTTNLFHVFLPERHQRMQSDDFVIDQSSNLYMTNAFQSKLAQTYGYAPWCFQHVCLYEPKCSVSNLNHHLWRNMTAIPLWGNGMIN